MCGNIAMHRILIVKVLHKGACAELTSPPVKVMHQKTTSFDSQLCAEFPTTRGKKLPVPHLPVRQLPVRDSLYLT